ncbi:MAG: hypothetical protein ACI4Q3_03765 [Kiritimatiellia bacterium]
MAGDALMSAAPETSFLAVQSMGMMNMGIDCRETAGAADERLSNSLALNVGEHDGGSPAQAAGPGASGGRVRPGYVLINYQEKASMLRRLRRVAATPGAYLRAAGILEEIILSMEWESFFCSKTAADFGREHLGAYDVIQKSLRLLEAARAIRRIHHGGMKRIVITPRLVYWGNPGDIEVAIARYDRHFGDAAALAPPSRLEGLR